MAPTFGQEVSDASGIGGRLSKPVGSRGADQGAEAGVEI